MMSATHQPFAQTYWLSGVLALNAIGAGINPAVAGIGALIAPKFGAGKWSPDMDVAWRGIVEKVNPEDQRRKWLRVLHRCIDFVQSPMRTLAQPYARWASSFPHRGPTHRPDTTAAVGTLVTLAIFLPVNYFVPYGLAWLLWVPSDAWWSHLFGDAIFGRIPVGRRIGKTLSHVLPKTLLVESRNMSGIWWIGIGLDTDGLIERGNRRTEERSERTGLRKTKKVLPFAPTTQLFHMTTRILIIAVVIQWALAYR
jgi:hypothetical protein